MNHIEEVLDELMTTLCPPQCPVPSSRLGAVPAAAPDFYSEDEEYFEPQTMVAVSLLLQRELDGEQ